MGEFEGEVEKQIWPHQKEVKNGEREGVTGNRNSCLALPAGEPAPLI
ncbi:hypothetical protein ACFLWG_04115 [Chloroflexota bacterium]